MSSESRSKAAERQRRYRLRKMMGLKQISIELDQRTIERLREIGYLTGTDEPGWEIGLFIEDALSRDNVTPETDRNG